MVPFLLDLNSHSLLSRVPVERQPEQDDLHTYFCCSSFTVLALQYVFSHLHRSSLRSDVYYLIGLILNKLFYACMYPHVKRRTVCRHDVRARASNLVAECGRMFA